MIKSLFFFILISLGCVNLHAQVDAPAFNQALQVILTDQTPINDLNVAFQNLSKANNGVYDLKPMADHLEFQNRISGYESFRILGFVRAAGEIGIIEAIDIITARIRLRSTRQLGFDQWTQNDVEAITTIAKKLESHERENVLLNMNSLLLSKSKQAPKNSQVAATVTYQLRRVNKPEPKVLEFVLKQLNSKNDNVRMAAAYAIVDIAPIEMIIAVWGGEGITPALQNDLRVKIAKGIYINKEVRENEQIRQLMKTALETELPEEVRKQFTDVLSITDTHNRLVELMNKMTPEKLAEFRRQVSDLWNSGSTKTCSSLFN